MSNTAPLMSPCEWVADKRGWKLCRGNVMVEGTSDVAYFALASRLNRQATDMDLLGDDFSIFAAGQGDEGGTYGISERFPMLFELASLEFDQAGRRRFRVIALLDDDRMGQGAVSGITRGHRRIVEYDSIFRLRRTLPQRAGSPKSLADKTKEVNAGYGGLECVIEDLLSDELCASFIKFMPHAILRPEKTAGSGIHRYWTETGKRELLKFCSVNAKIGDLKSLIGALRALRSYVGLAPDGNKR